MKPAKSSHMGVANQYKDPDSVSSISTDHVGLNAGDSFPGGKADGKGGDRGFHAPREANVHNPQNTHSSVVSERGGAEHVGPVSFPDEP